MALTVRDTPAPAPPRTLSHLLSLEPGLLERPEARAAHQRGLLRAKHEALRSAERLAGWARPLLLSVMLVSFLHLWHQIAQIAPAGVPPLPLPAWAHWLSAALLTASVDATALYLVATHSAAQYARLGGQGRAAVWFFYVLTAALNSVFVLSYTPGLPAAVAALTPFLSLLGAVLLGLLVPVSIAAVERAHQVADAARLALLVEVETLRGLVRAAGAAAQPPQTASTEGPADVGQLPYHEAPTTAAEGIPARNATKAHERFYACKRCGAGPLTFDELGRHSRRCQTEAAAEPVSQPAAD